MSKLDEMQILMSLNKVLLEHGHTTCLPVDEASLHLNSWGKDHVPHKV